MYDSTRKLHAEFIREDIHYIGIPMMKLSMEHYKVPRLQQLFKNIIYVGALAALLDMEMETIKNIISEQFAKKQKLILCFVFIAPQAIPAHFLPYPPWSWHVNYDFPL